MKTVDLDQNVVVVIVDFLLQLDNDVCLVFYCICS